MKLYLYKLTSKAKPFTPSPYCVYAPSESEARRKAISFLSTEDETAVLPSDTMIERENF